MYQSIFRESDFGGHGHDRRTDDSSLFHEQHQGNNFNNNNINSNIVEKNNSSINNNNNMTSFIHKTTTGLPLLVSLYLYAQYNHSASSGRDGDELDLTSRLVLAPCLLVAALSFLLVTLRQEVGLQEWWSRRRRWWARADLTNTTRKHELFRDPQYHHDDSDVGGGGGALARFSRVASNTALNFWHSIDNLQSSCSFRATLQAITRKECFARSDYIERLSINDVAMLYRYAMDVNLQGFDRKAFRMDQSEVVQGVMTAMDMAVKVSRGCLAEPTKRLETVEHAREGEVDALYFVAATRVFAEWRTLRLVPEGYQRYAVALSLGYRDMLQNLEKMERGVHDYLRCNHQQQEQQQQEQQQQASTTPPPPIPSPTLRDLLRYELVTCVHTNLPLLHDKSAASGLLWTKRQLHYQVATLSNSLEVPEYYPSSKEAAWTAYREVYQDYHGWAVKQIFSHSLGGSPPLDKIWTTMDPPKDLPNDQKKKKSMAGMKPKMNAAVTGSKLSPLPSDDYSVPERTFSDVTDQSSQRSDKGTKALKPVTSSDEHVDNEFLMALENMGSGIARKWDDMLRLFNCGGREEKNRCKDNLILSQESHFNLSQLEMLHSGVGSNHGGVNGSDMSVATETKAGTATIASTSNASSTSSSILKVLPNPSVHRDQFSAPNGGQDTKQDVADFVRQMSPMLADIGESIGDLNMNDPTRV